ncbi:MAG: dTMP kinase [Gemmataceae bacterium]|nr:dTMP kinase [Gemmataceae bacterium]MDW8264643.1 dTMP kinase [Gemmataceae bacterium]
MAQCPFLSLDGVDGCGKTTQCRLLAEWLRSQGRQVVEVADPGGTAVGQVIRELLLGHREDIDVYCEALLFMASRAQLLAEAIRPALARGQVVISDRYLLANVVYQGHAGGLDVDELWRIGLWATRGLLPDLTLVLDVPIEHAARRRRGGTDRLERRGPDFQQRVRAGFLAEAQRRPDSIRVIDATGSVVDVQARIQAEVCRVLAAGARP